jgi:hypothetical protein
MNYILEKNIWTETDFEHMGWHDATVYKIALNNDLLLDIDYIFKWNKPEIEGLNITFWIAPATLCFPNVKGLRFDIDFLFDITLEIDDIKKSTIDEGSLWTIITRQGEIEFISEGYTQTIRQHPSFQYRQFIGFQERGGISIEQITDQKNSYVLSDTYKDQRAKVAELYNHAKNYYQYKLDFESLNRKRDIGQVPTKDYLTQKKELTNMIEGYLRLLKGTQFEPM